MPQKYAFIPGEMRGKTRRGRARGIASEVRVSNASKTGKRVTRFATKSPRQKNPMKKKKKSTSTSRRKYPKTWATGKN